MNKLENQIVDKKFIQDMNSRGLTYKCYDIIGCKFIDLSPTDLKGFSENEYTRCKFERVGIESKFTNESIFKECIFLKVEDDSKYYNYLEGLELIALEEEITSDFQKCKFEDCYIGTYNKSTFIQECEFKNTYFKCGKYVNSYIQKNNFNECTFESVIFTGSRCNRNKMNYITDNVFDRCRFENMDFTQTLFINRFIENTYDSSTVIVPSSKSYIKKYIANYEEYVSEDCTYRRMHSKINTWRLYKELYFNMFNEYKRLSYQVDAYDCYYYYKYIQMKEHLEELKSIFSEIKQEIKSGVHSLRYVRIKCNNKKKIIVDEIISWKFYIGNVFGVSKKYLRDVVSYTLCGFGEKPFRLIITNLLVMLIFAIGYMFAGIKGNVHILYSLTPGDFDLINLCKDFVIAIYFSLVNGLFIVQSDYMPLGAASNVLILIQTIYSQIIMAIFTGLIIRKWFRY